MIILVKLRLLLQIWKKKLLPLRQLPKIWKLLLVLKLSKSMRILNKLTLLNPPPIKTITKTTTTTTTNIMAPITTKTWMLDISFKDLQNMKTWDSNTKTWELTISIGKKLVLIKMHYDLTEWSQHSGMISNKLTILWISLLVIVCNKTSVVLLAIMHFNDRIMAQDFKEIIK